MSKSSARLARDQIHIAGAFFVPRHGAEMLKAASKKRRMLKEVS